MSTSLGYRTYELPVTSFAKIPCGKNGDAHYYTSATSDQFAAETRLEATSRCGPTRRRRFSFLSVPSCPPAVAFTMGAGFVFARYDLFERARR